MRRRFGATILSICVLFGTCLGLVACNENDDSGNHPQYGEAKELWTDEELVQFHENGAKYPDNFVFEELSGYGRVISSASSKDEALQTAAKRFTNDNCSVVENTLQVETKLFYGLYVKWAYSYDGMDEPSYHDESVVSFKKNVYDSDTMTFATKDANAIKAILDYLHYSESYQTSGTKVHSSKIVRDGTQYVYTAFVLTVCYGDWDMQDELKLLKTELQIDRATGVTTYHYETVKTVFIDGALTNGPWPA